MMKLIALAATDKEMFGLKCEVMRTGKFKS